MYIQHPAEAQTAFKVELPGHAQSQADLPGCSGVKLSSKVELLWSQVREANDRAYTSNRRMLEAWKGGCEGKGRMRAVPGG